MHVLPWKCKYEQPPCPRGMPSYGSWNNVCSNTHLTYESPCHLWRHKTCVPGLENLSVKYKGKCVGSSCTYTMTSPGCVKGKNMYREKHRNLDDCLQKCSELPSCKAVEVYKDHGGQRDHYKLFDCQLNYGNDTSQCDGKLNNLDTYVKASCKYAKAFYDVKDQGGMCQMPLTELQCRNVASSERRMYKDLRNKKSNKPVHCFRVERWKKNKNVIVLKDDVSTCTWKQVCLCQKKYVPALPARPTKQPNPTSSNDKLIGTWDVKWSSGAHSKYSIETLSDKPIINVISCSWINCNTKNISSVTPSVSKKYPSENGWFKAVDVHDVGLTIYIKREEEGLKLIWYRPLNGYKITGSAPGIAPRVCWRLRSPGNVQGKRIKIIKQPRSKQDCLDACARTSRCKAVTIQHRECELKSGTISKGNDGAAKFEGIDLYTKIPCDDRHEGGNVIPETGGPPPESPTNSSGCVADSGYGKSKPCIFPYKFNGGTCKGPACCNLDSDPKGPWCPTEMHKTNNGFEPAIGEFGYCPKVCNEKSMELDGKTVSGTCEKHLTEFECKKMADKLKTSMWVETAEDWPAGCYQYNIWAVYFNNNMQASRKCSKVHPCFCKPE